jgi:hypothetical protein
MVGSRWLRWIGPGIVALGAVALVTSAAVGAGVRPWAPSACLGPPSSGTMDAREGTASAPRDMRGAPWFRLDPVLDGAGTLYGQRLVIGLDGERTTRTLDLPAEAFAAGPFGRVVLIGSDDGTTSRLRALDVAKGCAWALSDERDVIRRATVDPAGSAIYEMRVDRATRADLGVWRRPIDDTNTARLVLGPPPVDSRFGRTFSTGFSWDLAGGRLAVQSCGELACRIRVIAEDGDDTVALETPDLGPILGLDGDHVVSYEACRGFPCPIVATDLRDHSRRVLAPAAGLAVMIQTPDGSRVVHETQATGRRVLRSIAPDGAAAMDLGPIPDDLRLHPAADRAAAATILPPGWVLLAPDGRLPLDTTADVSELRHVPDGLTVPLQEAVR